MSKRFENKVAFITGGSQGIGKAITESFAKEGAKVAIIDINEDALNEVKQKLEAEGAEVFTKVANVVKSDEVETAMEEVNEKFGSVDILVNNAGILRDN